MSNPFRETENCLVNVDSKQILNEEASESVWIAKTRGEQAFYRLDMKTTHIHLRFQNTESFENAMASPIL